MSAKAFKTWRKRQHLTQSELAELLGLKSRMVQHYETGSHPVPRAVRLACAALEQSVLDYDGEDRIAAHEPLAIAYAQALDDTKLAEKKRRKFAEDRPQP